VIGHWEGGGPAGHFLGRTDSPTQLVGERPHARHAGGLVEPADLHVDRVHGPATDNFDDLVSDLLQPQTTPQFVTVIGGHGKAAVVPKEIGGVQQVDVQHVALDPLAAIQQATQIAQRLVERDLTERLEGLARAHLVGHRTDTADASRDVGWLGERTTAQERLEEARWFEDAQPDIAHLTIVDLDDEATLALHASECCDTQTADTELMFAMVVGHDATSSRSIASAACRNSGAAAWNVASS